MMRKLDFKNVLELLQWRKEILLDFIDNMGATRRGKIEYLIRIKEIDWLISKLQTKVESDLSLSDTSAEGR